MGDIEERDDELSGRERGKENVIFNQSVLGDITTELKITQEASEPMVSVNGQVLQRFCCGTSFVYLK